MSMASFGDFSIEFTLTVFAVFEDDIYITRLGQRNLDHKSIVCNPVPRILQKITIKEIQ